MKPKFFLNYILLVIIGKTAYGFSIKDFSRHINITNNVNQEWLLKTAIPSYIQEFINLHVINSTSGELLQSEWFDGVEWDCKLQVMDWLARLKPEHWNDIIKDENKWVLQMLDAWGKFPEGIMSGHTNSFGDFDQCIQTEANVRDLVIPDGKAGYSFSGMYCTVYLVPIPSETQMLLNSTAMRRKFLKSSSNSTKNVIQDSLSFEDLIKTMLGIRPSVLPLLPLVGTCFPNTCTQSDVLTIFKNIMDKFYSKFPIGDTKLYFIPVSCTDRHKPDLDAGATSVIALISILTGLTLVAGCVDYWQRHYKPDLKIAKRIPYKYLMAFSFYTNAKKLLSTHRSSKDLSCLHGIRFLSTAWVVLGHTYGAFISGPQWNLVDINNAIYKWTEMTILNASFSVDTFFLMSGLLATYNLLNILEKTNGKFNVVMFYVHRYIRLTPTYAILIGIAATLQNYAGNGPNWSALLASEEEFCRKNWWTNLLYVNNLVHATEMCNSESWYLANDMQFFILSPLIIFPLWRWEFMGALLLTMYTVMACIAPVMVTRYATDAPPADIITRPEAMGPGAIEIYARPWSRISPFLVGIWVGWILWKTKGRHVILSGPRYSLMWLASIGTALAVIFGIKPWFDPTTEIPRYAGYLYAGLSRFSFAVSVAWVIFACLKGYGGIVNEFLSWRAFMPLGRMCFCVYLTSIHLQSVFHARLTVPIKWDTYTVVNLYFAHLVMSYLVGFLCTLLFESPFMILQKLIFDGSTKQTGDSNQVAGTQATQEENNISQVVPVAGHKVCFQI